MIKIKSLPKHKRPREKLLEKGPENLSDYELLAILIRTGKEGKSAIDIAKSIVKKHKLEKLLSLSLQDLKEIKGIDTAKATSILAAFELSKRATKTIDNIEPLITSPQRALDQLDNLRNHRKEHFVALYLNARKELVHKETISIGSLTSSLVEPVEVFKPAFFHPVTSIIVAHNHPSGKEYPTKEDRGITKRLVMGADILGLKVEDHLIVTKNNYFSFRENYLLS